MQVDVLHGHDLRVTTTGRPTLHAETRTKRGLADADQGPLANAIEAVSETDCGSRLAFAGSGWIYRGHQDQFAGLLEAQGFNERQGDFRLCRPVVDQGRFRNADLR